MAQSAVNPLKVVQITDTHLYGASTGKLLKMNTHESLSRVIDLILANETNGIDLILATGDIAQDASPEAYEKFLRMIEPLGASCRWTPGNHDQIHVMEQIAGTSQLCDKSIRLDGWKILFLNTAVIGQVHGRLANEELEFLRQALADCDQDPTVDHSLLCMHHNPVQGNAGWMKDIGLHNADAFWEIVEGSRSLNAVVYGHIHQELDYEYQGVRCLCTPSTCIQFKPDATSFTLDAINPGYRRLHLLADGTIDSQVFRLGGDTLEADFSSSGY